jgi:VWFA-related protein
VTRNPLSRVLRYVSLLAVPCCAQDVKFSSDVKVVSLLATVHDSNGAIVKNLTKDDFRLLEDGRPQTIRYFSQESNLPLTIGMLVDTSRSMETVFEPERVAGIQFFNQVLRDDRDLAAIVHFDISVEILQGLTSSRDKLAGALAQLRVQRRISTLLYDAVHQSSDDIMRKQNGRKAFILLSDGMDVGSKTTIGDAIEYAQRADTIVYSILFAHSRPFRGIGIGTAVRAAYATRGAKAMERLARETGGEYFKVSTNNPIETIYAQIEEDLRNQYSIGYTSTRPDTDGKYRKLKLTTTKKGLMVSTRDGYYPK